MQSFCTCMSSDYMKNFCMFQNCLRRMDSTKRIKKELRLKRSSFLGIEGFDNDSYLDPGKQRHLLSGKS